MFTFQITKSASIAVFFVCTISATWPAAQAASVGQPADVQEIIAIERDFASQTDIDKVMVHFAPNAVVADFALPGWYVGTKEIYAAYQPQLAAVKSLKFHMDEINVASDGQMACAAMQIHFDATLKDNTSNSMTVRQLDGLKKIDGHWRIIQQQVSVPADQKTGMAALTGTLPARGDLAWTDHPLPRPTVAPEQGKLEIRKWTEDMAAPATLEEAVSYYGPGDDVILYAGFLPGELRGLHEIRDFLAPMMVGVRNLEIKIPAFFADSDGGFGVQISRQELKFNKTDGTSSTMAFRQSDCVRRVGGKWYSFLEMGTFPVDLKTGKVTLTNATGS